MSTSYINPPRKLLHHIDHVVEIRNGRKPAPVNVEIDLSNRCSLGCEWCHFAYTHTKGPLANKVPSPAGKEAGGDLMDKDLALFIMQDLTTFGVKSITWTGGGEPTLHPHFDEIINTCPIEQGVYTHGGHINQKRAALMKRRMKWVYISLDECMPEMYKKSKGVDRFADVLAGVTRLVEADGDAVIGLGFMLHKNNWRQATEMVNLGRSLGVDYIQFRPTILYKHDAPNIADEYTTWVDGAISYLLAYQDDPFIHADVDRFYMYKNWERSYETCYWTQLQSVITPNGKVWTCVNKREYAGECLGDLTKESFSEIWQRSGSCQVSDNCRLMCRGHIPNLTLNEMMTPPAHKEFI